MIKQFIYYLRLMSLDVVFGACVSTMFVAQYLEVTLPLGAIAALGIAVWIIYTLDHLLDAAKSSGTLIAPRHQFHQVNSKKLYYGLIAMIVLGLIVAFQLPYEIITNGFLLVLIIVLYFAGLHLIGSKPSFYKEPLVAVGYAAGIFLGPISMMNTEEYLSAILLFLTYLLLALINLLVFAVYEFHIDQEGQYTSSVRLFGIRNTNILIGICFVLLAALLILQSLQALDWNIGVLIMMSFVLLMIFFMKETFKPNEWYRVLGDGIFYFPLITLI